MLLSSVFICLYPGHSSEKLLEQSKGLDEIFPKIWKGLVKELTGPLFNIYQQSWLTWEVLVGD